VINGRRAAASSTGQVAARPASRYTAAAMIVSASRRCDLPAFAMDWLMARIEAGHCLVRNPFDSGKLRRVPLDPGSVDAFAFWTRDPRPLLSRADELEERGYRFFVQVTITGCPESLEPGVLRLGEATAAFAALSGRLGPGRIVWRYDPVILARSRGPGPDLDRGFHLANFEAIAKALEGRTERVVLSFLDEYRGTRSRLAAGGYAEPLFGTSLAPRPATPAAPAGRAAALLPEACLGLARELAAIARSRGMVPRSCAEPASLQAAGVEPGACIDPDLVERLTGRPLAERRDPGQRGLCRCAPSVDIGAYGTCPAGCAYCYARRGALRPLDPAAEAL